MRGGQASRMFSFVTVIMAGMVLLWAAMRFYQEKIAPMPSAGPAGAIVIITMMLGVTILVLIGLGSMMRR